MPRAFSKKIRYLFLDCSADFLLALSILAFRVVSPRAIVFIARISGTMLFYLVRKYRNRVFSNLSLAFGAERDSKEISKLAKEVFFNFSLTPFETILMAAAPLVNSSKRSK